MEQFRFHETIYPQESAKMGSINKVIKYILIRNGDDRLICYHFSNK